MIMGDNCMKSGLDEILRPEHCHDRSQHEV